MSLQLRARVTQRDVDVTVSLPAGQTLALLGANGSGKSTVLSLLAGLVRADAGEACLNGRLLFRTGDDGPAVWVPPHKRNTVLLAQEPLLFPHLSAGQNVAFGPRSRGCSRGEATATAEQWLTRVDAIDFAGRRPSQLSGGQAQRVALARALAAAPELLLLDEPLAALDMGVATAVRQTLRRVLAGRTAILVTHEILDAVLLADRIAVMEGGRVVEEGPTAQVLRQPRSSFAAGMSGLNMITGTASESFAITAAAGMTIHGEPDRPLTVGQEAIAVFRPSAVSVHRTLPTGSPRNVFTGSITAVEPQSHLIRVRMGDLSADITPGSVRELDLAVGTVGHFAVKAAEVSLYHV